jgi:uncharacterized damage-inducible protein DinB
LGRSFCVAAEEESGDKVLSRNDSARGRGVFVTNGGRVDAEEGVNLVGWRHSAGFVAAIPKLDWRTTMMKRMIAVLALAGCCLTGARAQMGAAAPKVPAGTMIEPSKSMDLLLKIYEDQIMGAVNAMPADKYNFAPSAAIFKPDQGVKYETVRTFGEMVGHIAQANYYFFSSIDGSKMGADVKAIGSMTSKEDLVKALAGSFAYAHSKIGTLTPANAFASVKDDQTKTSMAAFGIAHMCDHYGQLVEYLRMNGIVPPASQK